MRSLLSQSIPGGGQSSIPGPDNVNYTCLPGGVVDTHTRGNRRGPALSQLRLGEGSEQAGIFKRRETRESKGQGGSGAGCPVTEHCGKNWSSNLSSRAGQDMRTQHLERRVLGLPTPCDQIQRPHFPSPPRTQEGMCDSDRAWGQTSSSSPGCFSHSFP